MIDKHRLSIDPAFPPSPPGSGHTPPRAAVDGTKNARPSLSQPRGHVARARPSRSLPRRSIDASSQVTAVRSGRLIGSTEFASIAARFVTQFPFEIEPFNPPVISVRLPNV